MSRPSFRPRPIDLTKPLPIVWSGTDLRADDDVAVNRALPTIATGVDPSEETERHLKQALMASVYGDERRAAVDIPIPVVQRVEPPRRATVPWQKGEEYIMFDKSDHDLEDDCVEYDADHFDEKFVESVSDDLDMDTFERSMDALEKLQGRSEGKGLMQYAAMKAVLGDTLKGVAEGIRKKVHEYWVKRRTERGSPFLRLYQPPPDPGNNDPSVAFRPRDRDGSLGERRMNTYDNFKRAKVLRDELTMLRDVLDKIVERERQKLILLGVKLLQQRVTLTADGGARVEAVNRAIFSGEHEPVVMYGPPLGHVMIPCRNLHLPEEIEVVLKRLGNPTADKMAKKARRKVASKTIVEKAKGQLSSPSPDQRAASGGASSGVDTFGYDEHGNKFLKQMRYFAGGFMNYGVSPYDHRIFAAASERNTVRVDPTEPRPVNFPGPAVRFGTLRDTTRVYGGAKMEEGSVLKTEHICADILGEKRLAEFSLPAGSHRKYRKSYRIRGRVGRGGRIILDRVVYERERGAKAASYPASVEMGGVYTAGVPLDSTSQVADVVRNGALGEILKLGGGFDEDDYDSSTTDSNEGLALARKLIPPLTPMVCLNSGIGVSPDVANYWPRRSLASHRGGKRGRKDITSETSLPVVDDRDDSYRKLPAYALREKSLVSEV